MRILYCGERDGNSRSRFESMQQLGHICTIFDPNDYFILAPSLWSRIEFRFRNGLLVKAINRALIHVATSGPFDVVWIEKGMLIYPETIQQIKNTTNAIIVASHSDDFLDKSSNKTSRHFDRSIPLYDIIFTPRDINFDELYQRGAKQVEKFWKGYDENYIRPWTLTQQKIERFLCDVMFIGHYEEFRFSCLTYLLRKQVDLKIGGSAELWEKVWPDNLPLPHIGVTEGADFAKAYCGTKIGLNFFSRWARDTQNSRAFEIPATGTFMLCERSDDLMECFVEGVEAEFFANNEELKDKIDFYLKNEEAREKIASKGLVKSFSAGYSNFNRTKKILEKILDVIG